MPILTIIRGLPGSGKSSLAREISAQTGALLLEPDMLHVRNGKYEYQGNERHKEYTSEILGFAFHFARHFHCDIILCDVFPTLRELDVIKRETGCDDYYRNEHHHLRVIEMIITPEESKRRNRHNCRHEDIDRMAAAWEDFPGAERRSITN